MHLATFLDPTALAIVGGGTLFATMLRTPIRDLACAIRAVRTLARPRFSTDPLLHQLAAQAKISRSHGVLALDRAVITDPDLAAGIAAVVDGATPDQVTADLEGRRRARIERHAAAADAWAYAAEAAPAMGMVGTLIGPRCSPT